MKNVWIGGIAALALAWTAGAAAQTTSPGTSSNQAGQSTVTIVGCLKAADAMGATGTSGSAAPGTSSTGGSSAGGADRFMLTNASMGSGTSAQTSTSGAGTTTAGTAGTTAGTAGTTAGTTSTTSRPGTASGSMNSAGSSYMLDGNASELRPHVGHQVEITGRVDPSANRGSGTSTGTTAGGTTSTASTGTTTSTATTTTPGAGREGQANAAQNLRVESVRMIAATCPAP